MTRTVHYKQSYKIVINDRFYEVSDGNKVTHFGRLKHKPTLQEVWNKTIGAEQEKRLSDGKRTKDYNKTECSTNCCR